MRDEIAVVPKRKGRKRAGGVLCGFACINMNGCQFYAAFFGSGAEQRNILCCKRTLRSVEKSKTVGHCRGSVHARTELRNFCRFVKRQIPKFEIRSCRIGKFEAFIKKIFRVGQKTVFLFRRQNAKPLFPLFAAVPNTFGKQFGGISVYLELSRDPKTVNIHIPVGCYRSPRVFSGDIFDKTFAADITFQKNKSLVKTFRKPLFFRRYLNVLVVRNRTADMLGIKIFMSETYKFHYLLLL